MKTIPGCCLGIVFALSLTNLTGFNKMAAIKNVPQSPFLDNLPVSVQPDDLTATNDDDQELSDLLSELGGADDAHVNIYRVSGRDTRGGGFVESVHPTEFNLTWLRNTHGAGEYRLHVRRNKQLVANRLVKIAEIKNAAPAVPPVAPAIDGLRELAQTMQQGFMQLGELLLKTQMQNHAPPVDPLAAQSAALQNMLTMKQILAPSNPVPAADPMAMFMKGIEIAASLKGGDSMGEREPGGTDILMKALETFGAPIAAAVASAQQPPELPPVGYAPALPPVPPVPQIQPTTENQTMLGLRTYAAMLVSVAKENRDPFIYAGLVVDNAPPDVLGRIINSPNPALELAAFDKRLADPSLSQWLAEFIEEIKNILREQSDGDSVSINLNQTIVGDASSAKSIFFPAPADGSDGDDGNA